MLPNNAVLLSEAPAIPDEVFTVVAATLMIVLAGYFITRVLDFFRSVTHRKKHGDKRDPIRLYTRGQKEAASQRCDSRCEYGLLFRYKHTGTDLQGDHWYPHARGGMTSEKNLVMLCPQCNRYKSDSIPGVAMTWCIALRRRLFYNGKYQYVGFYTPGQWNPPWWRKMLTKSRK